MHSSPDVRGSIRSASEPIGPGAGLVPRGDVRAAARLEGFRAGREEGFAVGRLEGRATAEAALAGALDALRHTVEDLRAQDAAARLEVERISIELAVEIAAEILGREIELGETGRDAVLRALELRRRDEPVRVRLHPADAESARLVSYPDVEVVDDPTLGRGEARAELGDGFADLSIPAAVERVREALR